MFCENCGAAIKEGAKFCSQCGAVVKIRSAAAQPVQPGAPQPYTEDAAWQSEPKASEAHKEATYDHLAEPKAAVPYREAEAGSGYYNNNYYNGNTGTSRPAGRIKSAVAKLASSGLFLTASVLYTVALVLQLVSSVMSVSLGGNALMSLIETIIYQAGYSISDMGITGRVAPVIDAVSGMTVVTAIISMVPAILIAVGLWLILSSAKSSQGISVKPAGFTIIKVINLIYFWICIVVGAIIIILLIAAAVFTNASISSYSANYSGAALIPFIVLIALAAGIIALVCLYYSKIAKMLTSAREAGRGASDSLTISTYVQVITWIVGICMVISAVLSIGSAGFISAVVSSVLPSDIQAAIPASVSANISASVIFPFVQSICMAVATICFAVVIGKAKAQEY